jgi:hypothetical protein
MSMEYLLVVYEDDRDVLADGNRVGVTNHTIMLPTNEYGISLDGTGHSPASQDVVLAGTSPMNPKRVVFEVAVIGA